MILEMVSYINTFAVFEYIHCSFQYSRQLHNRTVTVRLPQPNEMTFLEYCGPIGPDITGIISFSVRGTTLDHKLSEDV